MQFEVITGEAFPDSSMQTSTREGLFPKLDGSCVPISMPASLRQGAYIFISVFFEPSNDSPKGVLDSCRMSGN